VKFSSRHGGYQGIVREAEEQFFSDGRSRIIRPMLVADFAEDATDETYQGQEGEPNYVAMRGGGFFDSEVAQARHNWTDEEREAVETRLLEIAKTSGDVKLWEQAKPIPPWPTYDEMHPDHVADRAIEMGLAQQALMYEERTLNRDEVTGRLSEYVQQQVAEDELTAA
jgi:hypothetical protein